MGLSKRETDFLTDEISRHLGAKRDGAGKNLIARCPYCGKEGKFGVYIGKETQRKKPFMSHCFSCGRSTQTLEKLLEEIGRPDLMVTPTTDLTAPLDTAQLFPLDAEEEIDDTLGVVGLPDFYRRVYTHPYLKSRGFRYDDYDYFEAGTTGKLNFRFTDYVIFPVTDAGDVVGYVARHIWPKPDIDAYNRKAKRRGDYQIRRFNNSTENDFVRLLYNYDSIVEHETDTVIIVEGIFDVVALVRKLELYDNTSVGVVATFGKKISLTQIYKLQVKGVRTVVVGYDGDAVAAINQATAALSPYFDVFVADIPDPEKDWQDLGFEEIFDVFTELKNPIQYKLSKLQE